MIKKRKLFGSSLSILLLSFLFMSLLAPLIILNIPQVKADSTTTWQVAADTDDGIKWATQPGWGWQNNPDYTMDDDNGVATAHRFLNVTIPKDAVIVSAYLKPTVTSVTGTLATQMSGILEANTTTLNADPYTRANTTATVNWDVNATGSPSTSPDIKSIIQEIVNQAGWVSGNALAIKWYNRTVSAGNNLALHGYSKGFGDAARLEVTVANTTPVYNNVTISSLVQSTVATVSTSWTAPWSTTLDQGIICSNETGAFVNQTVAIAGGQANFTMNVPAAGRITFWFYANNTLGNIAQSGNYTVPTFSAANSAGLYVLDSKIYNATGSQILWKGLDFTYFIDSSEGSWMFPNGTIAWQTDSPEGVGDQLDMLQAWGGTHARLLFVAQPWLNNTENYHDRLTYFINESASRNIYVTLAPYAVNFSYHEPTVLPWNEPGSDAFTTADGFIDFWENVSTTLKDYPTLSYDLWNEPQSSVGADEAVYLNVTQYCINAIRAVGSEQLIVIQWGTTIGMDYYAGLDPIGIRGDMTFVDDTPQNDSINGIVYSTHLYRNAFYNSATGNSKVSSYADMWYALNITGLIPLASDHPVWIGEIGYNIFSAYLFSDSTNETAWFNNTLTILDQYSIGYDGWGAPPWRDTGEAFYDMQYGYVMDGQANYTTNTAGQQLITHFGGVEYSAWLEGVSPSPTASPSPWPTPIIVIDEGTTSNAFYMRSDNQTTNGATGYRLATTNTASAITVNDTIAPGNMQYGFRAWLVHYNNATTELTSGTPTATVTRSDNGYGIQQSQLSMGNLELDLGYDALRIIVYLNVGGVWVSRATFLTEVLMYKQVAAANWTFSLYTYKSGNSVSFTFGSSTYPSRVSVVELVTPSWFEVGNYQLQSGNIVLFIFYAYTAQIGASAYLLMYMIPTLTLYIRHKTSNVLLFLFILLGGGSGSVAWIFIPAWAAGIVDAILLLMGSVLVWRVLR